MNLDFASVWEMISDIIPDNDALICGEDVVSWKDYDLTSSKIATALSEAGLSANSKAGLYLNNSNALELFMTLFFPYSNQCNNFFVFSGAYLCPLECELALIRL